MAFDHLSDRISIHIHVKHWDRYMFHAVISLDSNR